MSDYNSKIRDFFLKNISLLNNGISQHYMSVIDSYSDDELLKEYSELKSVTERKTLFLNAVLLVLFLSFCGGLYKIFVDFSHKVTDSYLLTNKSVVLVNGMLLLCVTLFVISFCLVLIYLNSIDKKKKKFYYVESVLRKKGLV